MSSSSVPGSPGDQVERRTWMPIYAITLQVLSTVFLELRIVSRCGKKGAKFGADDTCIILGWAFGTGITALVLLSTYTAGFDRHIYDVPPDLWGKGALYGKLNELLFVFASSFVKISALLFYRRLVEGTCSKRYKISVWLALGFVVVYTLVFTGLLITTCQPVEASWLRYDPTYFADYKCQAPEVEGLLSELYGALGVVTDAYTVVLPAFILLRLNIPFRQKVGLYSIFAISFLVIAAGIVRTIYLGKIFGGHETDLTWLGFNVYVATIGELQFGIIATCAPSLRALFRNFFRDHFSTQGSSNFRSNNSSNKPPPSIQLRRSPRKGRKVLSVESATALTQTGSFADMSPQRPRRTLREAFKWSSIRALGRPDIRETSSPHSSVARTFEEGTVDTMRSPFSPINEGLETIPEAYDSTKSRPSVVPSIASDSTFGTFQRWETVGRPTFEGSHSRGAPTSRNSAAETIYIGRAI